MRKPSHYFGFWFGVSSSSSSSSYCLLVPVELQQDRMDKITPKQRPRDMDRYRKLKEKGRVSPRAMGGVTFSPSTAEATTPENKNNNNSNDEKTPARHQRSMMPIANPYHGEEAPPTPQLNSTFGCSMLGVVGRQESRNDTAAAASANKNKAATNTTTTTNTSSRQQQLTVSLFDESKRQRYQKFKSRVRDSMSPRNNNLNAAATAASAAAQTTSSRSNKEEHQHYDLMSYEDTSDDKYALKSSQEPKTNDKYSFPYNRDFATGTKGTGKSDQQNNVFSSGKGSAFRSPISTFFHRREQSPANGDTRRPNSSRSRQGKKHDNLPGPPSVATSTQTSSHPLNSFGLPIASAHHGPSTPKTVITVEDEELPSVVNVEDSRRPTSTNRSNSRPFFAPPTPEAKKTTARGNAMGAIGYSMSSRTPSPYAAGRHSNRSMDSFNSKPPHGHGLPTGGSQQKPGLFVNTKSTPTSKPPPITFSYSSERGITPPPQNTQKTPMSLTGSESTSSTAKRDRILEARGMAQEEERFEAREPLNEVRRNHMDHPRNISENRSPAPSLEMRPSLDLPSLKSRYSPGASQNTNPKTTTTTTTPQKQTPNSESRAGVTPLDFYRRIAAERTNQALMARRRTGSTPTKEESSTPTRRLTPVFRSESPRCSSVPALDQRTVRILYSKHFDPMVREHIAHHTHIVLQQASRRNDQQGRHGVSVFARKRPLLEDEVANGEFDIVNADTGNANAIIVYVTSMLSDLQTKDIQANLHEFDHVFAESRLAEDFYMRVGQEGVMRAREGGAAAFVILGTSGSGKAHSMADIEERAAYDLFETSRGTRPISVSVQYMFLTGDTIVDLLGPAGCPVHVVDEGGRFRVKGVSEKQALGPRELLDILSDVRRRLFRASTVRRQEIAEAFIVCQITVNHTWAKGSLILLKCPSHELSKVSNGDARKASTFDELMQGIRAKGRGGLQEHPFRGKSNISKIMQDIFNDNLAQISLVATVSPAASSTEETLAVLDSVSSVACLSAPAKSAQRRANQSPKQQENESPTSVDSSGELSLPRQWSRDELNDWMKRKNLLEKPVPPDVDGRFAMRMSKDQLKSTFYDGRDFTKAERLHMALRAENDRVARMRVKVRMARDRQRMLEQY